VNLQEVLNQAKQLSPVDKVRLIQQIAFDIENELRNKPTPPPAPSPQHPQNPQHPQPAPQWDMSGDMGNRPSAPDIDPSRWEDWANFPD
jgi:hypothetical protein